MATSFLTNLNEEEFKNFLKQALAEILGEILGEKSIGSKSLLPEILDIKQAAEFLKLQVTTLYEKTSRKIIPHFKKGNKLYFNRIELQDWVLEGKVSTKTDLQAQAATYTMHKDQRKRKH